MILTISPLYFSIWLGPFLLLSPHSFFFILFYPYHHPSPTLSLSSFRKYSKMGDGTFSDIFEENEFGDTNLAADDLFRIFESLESVAEFPSIDEGEETGARLVSQKSTSSSALQEWETELLETSPKSKRPKLIMTTSEEEANPEGQQRMSHITVERNRRKQMNEHLSVLRSLMPCFYVKRVS